MSPLLLTVQAVDPAIGTSERADFFCIATVTLDTGTRRFYVRDMLRTRAEAPDQVKLVVDHFALWKPYAVGVESIFYQSSLFQALRREGTIPLREIPRRAGTGVGKKWMRLAALAARYEQKQVIHPASRPPWLEAYETELCSISFADGKELHAHDDQADAAAMAVEMLTHFLTAAPPGPPTYSPVRIGG